MHKPVLLNEILENLPVPDGGVFVDGTVGNGGHSREIAKSKNGKVKIVGLDMDSGSIERARKNLSDYQNVILRKSNFKNMDTVLKEEGIDKVDAILLDLGFSSDQLESSERGFSFKKDEPLLMTLNDDLKVGDITARTIVNEFEEDNLNIIIRNYGEEKMSRKIAEAIVRARKIEPITTSGQLAEIIESAVRRKGKIHPATKTFQALRIAVNDELRSLEEVLPKAVEFLKKGGRLGVISFHSLEDRIVKKFSRESRDKIKIINKKPIISKGDELEDNPRSRSAKLRILEKI
jgi:16S rRNA (cytosine1402-N4)-methyltransferase